MKSVKEVMKGNEVGDTGAQRRAKGMFWLMCACMAVLMVSGLIARRQYFAGYFPIPVVRLALLAHASRRGADCRYHRPRLRRAVGEGTIRAMVEGVVTHAWAKHHPRWYREMTGKKS